MDPGATPRRIGDAAVTTSGDDVIDVLGAVRVLPVVTIDDAAQAVPLARALVDGGITAIEITLRTPVALDAIGRVAAAVPATVVGAGSVMSASDATAAVEAGARFVVSPGFDDDTVATARRHGVRAVPGVATATELQRAANSGVDVVKLFPASLVGGPALIEAMSAVWPSIRFVPTGGITASSAPDYLALPSVVAVGGSWMVPSTAVAAGDWPAVTSAAAHAVRLAEDRP